MRKVRAETGNDLSRKIETDGPALPCIVASGEGWYIFVQIQPGAGKDELCGLHGERLKIRLSAPAVDNRANSSLLEFMADRLHIRKNGIFLVGGEKSRKKKLFVPAGEEPLWNEVNNLQTGG
ncbi:MAG: DUF167 domain-containing protein [Deltaproteobacteria bacterium]|jgi:uncharacterized protein (TIGR00251 family)|nr:DUF167 domain-containing protein [Deltaproteobacteria bacterium]